MAPTRRAAAQGGPSTAAKPGTKSTAKAASSTTTAARKEGKAKAPAKSAAAPKAKAKREETKAPAKNKGKEKAKVEKDEEKGEGDSEEDEEKEEEGDIPAKKKAAPPAPRTRAATGPRRSVRDPKPQPTAIPDPAPQPSQKPRAKPAATAAKDKSKPPIGKKPGPQKGKSKGKAKHGTDEADADEGEEISIGDDEEEDFEEDDYEPTAKKRKSTSRPGKKRGAKKSKKLTKQAQQVETDEDEDGDEEFGAEDDLNSGHQDHGDVEEDFDAEEEKTPSTKKRKATGAVASKAKTKTKPAAAASSAAVASASTNKQPATTAARSQMKPRPKKTPVVSIPIATTNRDSTAATLTSDEDDDSEMECDDTFVDEDGMKGAPSFQHFRENAEKLQCTVLVGAGEGLQAAVCHGALGALPSGAYGWQDVKNGIQVTLPDGTLLDCKIKITVAVRGSKFSKVVAERPSSPDPLDSIDRLPALAEGQRGPRSIEGERGEAGGGVGALTHLAGPPGTGDESFDTEEEAMDLDDMNEEAFINEATASTAVAREQQSLAIAEQKDVTAQALNAEYGEAVEEDERGMRYVQATAEAHFGEEKQSDSFPRLESLPGGGTAVQNLDHLVEARVNGDQADTSDTGSGEANKIEKVEKAGVFSLHDRSQAIDLPRNGFQAQDAAQLSPGIVEKPVAESENAHTNPDDTTERMCRTAQIEPKEDMHELDPSPAPGDPQSDTSDSVKHSKEQLATTPASRSPAPSLETPTGTKTSDNIEDDVDKLCPGELAREADSIAEGGAATILTTTPVPRSLPLGQTVSSTDTAGAEQENEPKLAGQTQEQPGHRGATRDHPPIDTEEKQAMEGDVFGPYAAVCVSEPQSDYGSASAPGTTHADQLEPKDNIIGTQHDIQMTDADPNHAGDERYEDTAQPPSLTNAAASSAGSAGSDYKVVEPDRLDQLENIDREAKTELDGPDREDEVPVDMKAEQMMSGGTFRVGQAVSSTETTRTGNTAENSETSKGNPGVPAPSTEDIEMAGNEPDRYMAVESCEAQVGNLVPIVSPPAPLYQGKPNDSATGTLNASEPDHPEAVAEKEQGSVEEDRKKMKEALVDNELEQAMGDETADTEKEASPAAAKGHEATAEDPDAQRVVANNETGHAMQPPGDIVMAGNDAAKGAAAEENDTEARIGSPSVPASQVMSASAPCGIDGQASEIVNGDAAQRDLEEYARVGDGMEQQAAVLREDATTDFQQEQENTTASVALAVAAADRDTSAATSEVMALELAGGVQAVLEPPLNLSSSTEGGRSPGEGAGSPSGMVSASAPSETGHQPAEAPGLGIVTENSILDAENQARDVLLDILDFTDNLSGDPHAATGSSVAPVIFSDAAMHVDLNDIDFSQLDDLVDFGDFPDLPELGELPGLDQPGGLSGSSGPVTNVAAAPPTTGTSSSAVPVEHALDTSSTARVASTSVTFGWAQEPFALAPGFDASSSREAGVADVDYIGDTTLVEPEAEHHGRAALNKIVNEVVDEMEAGKVDANGAHGADDEAASFGDTIMPGDSVSQATRPARSSD